MIVKTPRKLPRRKPREKSLEAVRREVLASREAVRLTAAEKAELEARAAEEQGELTPLEDVIAEVEQIARGRSVVHVEPLRVAK